MTQRRVAARVEDIEPFHVMDILARARDLEAGGRDIVHMEIGEPDFVSPAPVIQAGIHALQQGYTHYTPARGLPALRHAIAQYYHRNHGVAVSPERIVITPGASGALQLVMALLVDPGAEVLIPDPGYPCNRHFVRLMEGKALSVPVTAQSDYQITAAAVASCWTPRTTALLIASPANPTGAIANRELLTELAAGVEECGGTLIVDEIYQGLIYSGDNETVLRVTEEAFVINSFSKFFGMTGWRLGWVVVPQQYVEDVNKLAQNLFLCAPTPAQHAAMAAFEPDTMAVLEQRRLEFMQRRDYLLPALRGLGFDIPVTPRGAFYIYAGCRDLCADSHEFAMDVLEQAGVAITPGLDFGDYEARSHVRFAYTTTLANLEEGVRRLKDYLR